MNYKNIFLLTLFISLLPLNLCGIKIISPLALSVSFNDEDITASYGDFSHLTNGFEAVGRITIIPKKQNIPTQKNDICDSITNVYFPTDNSNLSGINILLAEKSSCSYEEMARAAQRKGANMLLIVNDVPGSVENVKVSSDSKNDDIFIPVALISYNDGYEIINFINQNPNEKVYISVSVKENKNDKVKVDFFVNILNKESLEILTDFKNYYNIINKDVQFNIYYVTPQIDGLSEKDKALNCLANGQYCIIKNAENNQKNFMGYELVLDSIFHQSIYLMTKKTFFTFIKEYYNNCFTKSEYKVFCAADQFSKDLKDLIFENVFSSFGGKYDEEWATISEIRNNLDSYLSNTNSILVNNRIKEYSYKVKFVPQVIINEKQINGRLSSENIFQNICGAFNEKPDYCGGSSNEKNKTTSSGFSVLQIIFVVIAIIIVNIFLFFCIKKYILDKLMDRINSDKINLTSEINSVCNSYFSLRDMETKKISSDDYKEGKTKDLGDVHNFMGDEEGDKENEPDHDNNLVMSNNISEAKEEK